MMRLPEFTNPNPTSEELQLENDRLIKQADKLLEETGILDVFSRHGDLGEVGGSYKYELMTYPDLDFGLVVDEINKQVFSSLLADLATQDYIRKISTVDTIRFRPSNHADKRPKGYWIGLEIPFEDDKWGLDCWLLQRDWVGDAGDAYYEKIKALSHEQKNLILHIKYDLIRRGLYGSEFTSGHVYDAVIEGEVSSLDEFYSKFSS